MPTADRAGCKARLGRHWDRLRKLSSGWPFRIPTASITSYLTFLAAAIAMPLIAFAAFLFTEIETSDRDALRAKTAADARTLGRIVERHLHDMTSTLRLLAVFPELEQGDLEGFQSRTQHILSSHFLYLLLVDESGQQLLNTRVPYGAPLGPMSDMLSLEAALANGQVSVSNMFFGQTGQEWVFNVTLPLPETLRHVGAALILTQGTQQIEAVLSRELIPAGWNVTVVDQKGLVIASSGTDGPPSATPFPHHPHDGFRRFSDAVEFRQDGEVMVSGYARLTAFPWVIVLSGPLAAVQSSVVTWKLLVFGSIALIALSMLMAYLVARHLGRSITGLSRMAERMGRGEVVAPLETRVIEVNQISIALCNASFDRSEAESRVHLLLRELVHRTKNVLTLVQAILRQIARQSATKEEFQEAADSRLQGLAQSVELLAQENWYGVSLRELIDQHLSTVGVSLEQRAIAGEDFVLGVSAVQNLGLVLHELATNSIKYGALQSPQGCIHISWSCAGSRRDEPAVLLEWREEGGPPVAPPQRSGFGSIIIERHAAAAFSAGVTLEYRPEGLYWALHAPWSALRKEGTTNPLDAVAENLASKAAE